MLNTSPQENGSARIYTDVNFASKEILIFFYQVYDANYAEEIKAFAEASNNGNFTTLIFRGSVIRKTSVTPSLNV